MINTSYSGIISRYLCGTPYEFTCAVYHPEGCAIYDTGTLSDVLSLLRLIIASGCFHPEYWSTSWSIDWDLVWQCFLYPVNRYWNEWIWYSWRKAIIVICNHYDYVMKVMKMMTIWMLYITVDAHLGYLYIRVLHLHFLNLMWYQNENRIY